MTAQVMDRKAQDILRANDRGGYTVPNGRVYPFQWNWDSAFVALGFDTFDRDRAWTEIETLFKAQWDDGFLPHIVFWEDDPGYFPGPSVWGTGKTPVTSGITQPPVAATVVRKLWDHVSANRRFTNYVPKESQLSALQHKGRIPADWAGLFRNLVSRSRPNLALAEWQLSTHCGH